MPWRLDRETSGALVLARTKETGTRLQRAVQFRKFRKTYHAVLTGHLETAVTVNAAIGPDAGCRILFTPYDRQRRRRIRGNRIHPIAHGGAWTLARIHPHSGRRHQIRVHAASIGHPLAGDKLYGPDPALMLRFMREGMSPRIARSTQARSPGAPLHTGRIRNRTRNRDLLRAAPRGPRRIRPHSHGCAVERIDMKGRESGHHRCSRCFFWLYSDCHGYLCSRR